MRIKRKVLIIFFCGIFVSLIGIYLFKNKDITYKSVSSESKKYLISFENDSKKTETCDRYYEGVGTKIFKMNEVEEKFPLFILDSCAVELDYYLNAVDDDTNACSAQKEYVQKNSFSNKLVSNYNSLCSELTGEVELELEEVVCNPFNTITSGSYDIDDFAWEDGTGSCTLDSNPLKGQTGILRANVMSDNKPHYLVQGCVWSYPDIVENNDTNQCITDEFKKSVCEEEKRFVENSNDNNLISQYNNYCSSISGSVSYFVTIDVVFRANDGFKMTCREVSNDRYTSVTTAENECTYHFNNSLAGTTVTLDASELPDTTSLKQLTTNAIFNGWRRGSETSCSTKGGSLSIELPLLSSTVEYKPCYSIVDEATEGYTLYQNCNGDYENNSNKGIDGTIDVGNQALLSSSFSSSKKYATTSLVSTTDELPDSRFKLNNFCTVTCTEKVNYDYSSIFETVKSGTYFQLLSYPEVKSSLECVENFNYDNWKGVYTEQIEKEKIAYVNKKNSENISNLNFSPGGVCKRVCSNPCEKGCCGYTYYYNQDASTNIYSYDSVSKSVTSRIQSFSYCEYYSSKEDTINSAKVRYGVNDGSVSYYNGLYNTSVNTRGALETANTDCINVMKRETISTDKFYDSNVNLYFYYESDYGNNIHNLDGDATFYHKDELEITTSYVSDTDVHDYNETSFDETKIPIDRSYDGNYTTPYESVKTNDYFLRTVIRNFVSNKSQTHSDYYTKNQTGEITTSSSNSIKLGYVYPINLTLSGTRNVYFALKFNTNLGYGSVTKLNNDPSSVDDINVYQCNYDISNDIIVEDKEEDKYKKNFYVRSVSTQDVDPNNRFDKGLLGANWSDDKGQTLIKVIEKNAEGNNTYSPNNLEYSFTLDALAIETIRQYNKDQDDGYSDFTLKCNNIGGECESKFLNGLASGSLGTGMEINDVYAKMPRNTWKYYINGSWLKTKSLIETSDWTNILTSSKISADEVLDVCSSKRANGDKAVYDCLYRYVNKGVLP